MTQTVYKFVFYTLGRVYEDPFCAEANQALASQKKILNTYIPLQPFPHSSLPFFLFHLLLFSLVPFLGKSLGAAVTIDTGGEKQ